MDTLAVIGVLAIVAVGGAVAYLLKSNTNSSSKINDSNRMYYERNKTNIENFIRAKDWEALENMLPMRVLRDFPDLDKMVKDALKNKPKS